MVMYTPIREEPQSPAETLMLSLSVGLGHNQIRRTLGLYSQNYVTDQNVSNLVINVVENTPFSGSRTACLVIYSFSPITIKVVKDDDSEVVLDINNMFVLDTPIKSYEISTTSREPVRVNINSIS